MTTPTDTPTPCPGEYDHVAKRSRDLEALREVHATPCTPAEATAILRELAARYLPTYPYLKISWGTKRGRGGFIFEKKREPWFMSQGYGPSGEVIEKQRYRMRRGNRVPFVSLPRLPMTTPGVWWSHDKRSSLLRVGLVLHEFAHVLSTHRFGICAHGQHFVEMLDLLIAERGRIAA